MRRLLALILGVALATSTLAGVQASAEPAQPRAAKKLVTLTASKTDLVGGRRLVLRGTARTERGVKRMVSLEVKVMGKWGTFAKMRTSRTGAYKFYVTSPNPAAALARVDFRVRVEPTKNKLVRKAWRKQGRSTSTRITFRNNPSVPQPTYTLADPVACDSGTAGVMARTAACVAAVEAQFNERLWLDMRLSTKREEQVEAALEAAVQLQPATTRSQEFANLRVILPHVTAALNEADYVAEPVALDMMLFAFFWIGAGIEDEVESIDPAAATATAWKPAWTEHFIVKDLAQITLSGDTATTPQRTFTGGSGELTLGGAWKYTAGRWYSALDPDPALRGGLS